MPEPTKFELEKKTGVLNLVAGRTASIHIDHGRPLKVEITGAPAGRTSRELLGDLLDWTEGQFDFAVMQVGCPDEVRASLTSILLDHARVSDEEAR